MNNPYSMLFGVAMEAWRRAPEGTRPPTNLSNGGQFLYAEQIQKQGYTNKGFILGDPVGRESKGGQAWVTYHLAPRQ
ncbi:capsule assembly Wzi family protein [Tunturibacter empetritectus]|uniref:Uncharacterized protein n=2 Tax=Tunturiibacter empetritectus TaxID=3069691 RepID=A0A7W8ILW7_9BACT|nr:capsule assembly Wzi family protein [Edaphobacter lichenicola]MBB5319517.1 hypothetical protein [Edaphobacter lichenicola]